MIGTMRSGCWGTCWTKGRQVGRGLSFSTNVHGWARRARGFLAHLTFSGTDGRPHARTSFSVNAALTPWGMFGNLHAP